jgi:hypothetical protein
MDQADRHVRIAWRDGLRAGQFETIVGRRGQGGRGQASETDYRDCGNGRDKHSAR